MLDKSFKRSTSRVNWSVCVVVVILFWWSMWTWWTVVSSLSLPAINTVFISQLWDIRGRERRWQRKVWSESSATLYFCEGRASFSKYVFFGYFLLLSSSSWTCWNTWKGSSSPRCSGGNVTKSNWIVLSLHFTMLVTLLLPAKPSVQLVLSSGSSSLSSALLLPLFFFNISFSLKEVPYLLAWNSQCLNESTQWNCFCKMWVSLSWWLLFASLLSFVYSSSSFPCLRGIVLLRTVWGLCLERRERGERARQSSMGRRRRI